MGKDTVEKKDSKTKSISRRFDPFNPLISEVVSGVDGKVILVYSDENKVGKTKVGVDLPKPYYLRFESGLTAIEGVPYAPLTCWADFKQLNYNLTNSRKLARLKELYQTIIIDTIDVAVKWCASYVCDQFEASSIKSGNSGYGLWREYEDEWFLEMNKLLNCGYTIYAIAHADTVEKVDPNTKQKYMQWKPFGDKRTTKLIQDTADFCGYVQSNGVDANNDEIPSSIYFVETPQFVAGSRFDIVPKIEVFSAKNLEAAIEEAVNKGKKVITREENIVKEEEHRNTLTYDEIIQALSDLWDELGEKYNEQLCKIVDEYLGPNKRITDVTEKQMQQLEMILFEFEQLRDE